MCNKYEQRLTIFDWVEEIILDNKNVTFTSALGILLPAMIFVTVIASFFSKLNHYPVIQSMFYGFRPIVTSLILFSAISLALSNHMIAPNFSWHTINFLLIFGLSLFALM
ncbi:chromate transporter, partial [Peribacillus sp. NPDC060186]